MKYFEKLHSIIRPSPEVINEYFVYVNTDIKEVTVERGWGEWKTTYIEYEFNQTEYTKDEYISLLSERNTILENQVTDTQLALCEVYEMML